MATRRAILGLPATAVSWYNLRYPMLQESQHSDEVGLSTAQMKHVLTLSRLFAVTANLEALLEKVATSTCSLLKCGGSSIWLHDAVNDELYTTVVIKSGSIRVPASSGIVGTAFKSNRSVRVGDAYKDSRFNPSSDLASGFVTKSLMAAPIVDIQGTPIGVIEVVNKTVNEFTSQDEQLIQLFADQVGVAIQRHRLQQTASHAAELQREISLAREVQQGLLPKTLPSLAGFDLFGWAKSASTTGGDCYDLWLLEDGRLGIFMADASGHGLGPALVVSQIRTLVRTLCDGTSGLCDPHEVLMRVDRRLSNDLESDRFVTAFLGFLSGDGTLVWQSAGHGPILFRGDKNQKLQSIAPVIPPINTLNELFHDRPKPLHLGPGGTLVVLSDGIFESFGKGNELFSIERVIQALEDSKEKSSADSVGHLIDRVVAWQSQEQPKDDQTIILLNRIAE